MHGNVYPKSANIIAVIGIGSGSTVKGTDGVVVDDNSTVYIGKGSHCLSTFTQVKSMNFTAVNSKGDFTLRTLNDKFNFAGLPDNYAVTLSAGGNIGEQINFQTGGRGTISVGDTSLIINGDTNFDLKLKDGIIASLENFVGGAGFRKITVADYVEGEDVVFHGSSFKAVSPLSMAKLDGDDFALSIGPVATVVKNAADKKIKMIDSTGEVTYVGNYWQVQDFDPEEITSTSNVNIIDALIALKM